ncbi:MAG: hypothetical protein IPN19_11360 [Elusimicrobia bacterium]|nr:hypothetical protein [Elusimicrobiota bacterium]
MASRAQSLTISYVAWDTANNVGKTGDVANHTLRWIKDGTSSAPTNSASEVDSTNAPGIYKITLTTAECACDYGTLAGKSSTANISILPTHISFEQLPTAAPGADGGVPIVDASARVKANIEAIDGLATSGNNATLNLKSLNIQNSTGTAVVMKSIGSNGIGIDVAGHGTGIGFKIVGGTPASGDGSDGLYIEAGTASMGNTGGNALRAVGGSVVTSGNGGDAFSLEGGSGSSFGQGLYIHSVNGVAAYFHSDNVTALALVGRYAIEARGFDSGLYFQSDSGNGATFEGASGAYGINVIGGANGIGITRPKKNIALNNFMFPMFDSTTKNPIAGLVVTAERAIDGNPFAPCSSGVAEISNGTYRINLSADDMNGEKIMLRFSATGADVNFVELITQD